MILLSMIRYCRISYSIKILAYRDVGLHEVVLCEVADALLGDDDVRVESHDLRADVLYVLLLHPEQGVPVLLLRHLNVCLALRMHEISQNKHIGDQNRKKYLFSRSHIFPPCSAVQQ